jgi:hypothetical protein
LEDHPGGIDGGLSIRYDLGVSWLAVAQEEKQRAWQAEADRRMRFRHQVSTNEGTVVVEGTGNAFNRLPDGEPVWLTRVNVTSGPTYVHMELTDAMLAVLVDVLNKFLARPQPPVQVDVKIELRERPRRRRRKAAAAPVVVVEVDHEKEAIKRRMLGERG